ncbi:MAG: apolipoprotein N-acyltransferase [Leptospiraceae bacterium]|nr:apolipoprotein N-acyltransferase [Leptospiraceae bacterium]MCK6382340.1 apolipoprotein N-acyltransferase [Leptospiraceae bacterium]NUM40363.1 apolipoprotein N-acyltransferase [Leptospiraceae bacterium]
MENLYSRFRKFKKTKVFNIFCYIWVALFSTLSFAPYHLTHFVWIAPFGLFWLEEKYIGKTKKLIFHGIMVSLFFCTFSFFWINHLLVVFGNFPFFLAFPIFLIYAAVFNLKFPFFLIVFSYFTRKLGRHHTLIAGFVALLSEFFTFQLFPWYWGNLAAGNILLAQTAEYASAYGLTFLIFIVSYCIYNLNIMRLEKFILHKKKRILYLKFLSFPIFLFVFFLSSGFALYNKWSNISPKFQKQVLMIQPDAPLEFRDGRSVKETMENLMLRIEELIDVGSREKKPDIVVLPESGVPFFSTNKTPATTMFRPSYWERFESLIYLTSQKYKANVFFNEIDASFAGGEINQNALRYHNSSVLYDPNGQRGEYYRKSYLLAFGEYIPFGETFEFLYDLIPQVGRFIPGERQNLITYFHTKNSEKTFKKKHIQWQETSSLGLNSLREYYKDNISVTERAGKFLPLICYEVIIPEFVRRFVQLEDPDFILNVTNDKWYGKSVETYEHLDLARLRSIELRKWMVRSTNSGTSVFVDHLGRIVDNKFTGQETSEYYSKTIDIIKERPTFYALYGNLLLWIFLSIAFIYYLHSVYISKKLH